jgi:hypothetical protein
VGFTNSEESEADAPGLVKKAKSLDGTAVWVARNDESAEESSDDVIDVAARSEEDMESGESTVGSP